MEIYYNDISSHAVAFGNTCVVKHRDWATERYVNNIVEYSI